MIDWYLVVSKVLAAFRRADEPLTICQLAAACGLTCREAIRGAQVLRRAGIIDFFDDGRILRCRELSYRLVV